ncbi:MAG: DUF5658 family protein [Methanohalobium sp.]|uniref:DUF5658 family protein n=1 Tax=Methanohalobium sp. TaxID=2837493 RepID=UPI00397AC97B
MYLIFRFDIWGFRQEGVYIRTEYYNLRGTYNNLTGLLSHQIFKFLVEVRYIIAFYIIGDILTTWFAITYGYGYEGNSLPSAVISEYGFTGLTLLKLLVLIFLYFCYIMDKKSKKGWKLGKHSINIMGVLLVASNITVILFGHSFFSIVGVV